MSPADSAHSSLYSSYTPKEYRPRGTEKGYITDDKSQLHYARRAPHNEVGGLENGHLGIQPHVDFPLFISMQ
jgi:hypothetical protein